LVSATAKQGENRAEYGGDESGTFLVGVDG
jgi:hypothetical protein